MALFAQSTIGSTEGNQHYVEMRAGKMYRQGTMVYPDLRKGLLYIYQNFDALMHFCWKCRTTDIIEDDFIIFPGDCEYSRVKQCHTGRVYLLKFNHSAIRCFYWLQEPTTDKDDEHCTRINYMLNHPPKKLSDKTESDEPFLLDEMDTAQLVRVFGPQMGVAIATILAQSRASNSSDPLPMVDKTENSDITPVPTTSQSSAATSADNIRKNNLKPADYSPKFLLQENGENKTENKKVKIKDNEKEEIEEASKKDDDDDEEDDEELD